MYMVLADYGFMCRLARPNKFKNILDAKDYALDLKKHDEYLKQEYGKSALLLDIKVHDIKYFVVHESEVNNELY